MDKFEPGNVCYYGPDSESVIMICCDRDKTAKVCPREGGSTFSVDPKDLRFDDGSVPSGIMSAVPDSQISLCMDGRRRQRKDDDDE